MPEALPYAAATVMILWLGKLIPRVPAPVIDVALAVHVAIGAIWLLVLFRPPSSQARVYLESWETRWVPLGLLLGAGLFVVGGAGYALSARVLGLSPPTEASLAAGGSGLRLGLILAFVLLAALLEEWVFRGVAIGWLEEVPRWAAVLASAGLFAIYHGSLFQLAPTFLLGIGLGAIALGYGSLWPAIIAHGTFNLIGIALTIRGGTPSYGG